MRKRTSKITIEAAKANPKWSKAYVDPTSNFQSFVNPFALEVERLDQNITELNTTVNPWRIDPDSEPWRAWVVTQQDILNQDVTFFDNVSSVVGVISGESIDLRIDDNNAFLTAAPTAFFLSGTYALSGIGYTPRSCAFNPSDNSITITYDGTTSIQGYQLPTRWGGSSDIESITIAADPLLQDINLNVSVKNTSFRTLINRPVLTTLSGLATDMIEEAAGNTVLYPLSGVVYLTDVNTSDWNTEHYMEIIDFDNDGVIDSRELTEINTYVGYKRSDFTDAVWRKTYDKYDINGNGEIDMADVNIVKNAQNSVRYKGAIVNFRMTGRWSFALQSTTDGKALTSGFLLKNNELESVRGETYNALWRYLPEGYTQGVWHPYMEHYFFMNDIEHLIAAVKLEGAVVRDIVKYPLPIRSTGSELRGIALWEDNLAVLRKDDLGFSILYMNTLNGAPDYDITVAKIHDGTVIENDVYVRNATGLSDAHGLTFIGPHKFATVDGNALKVILPLFDSATIYEDAATGAQSFHMREKYSSLQVTPVYTIYPTFYYLFNQIDHFAFNFGLQRLPGEDNWSLKQRYLDVWSEAPNRSRDWIVQGIARELGSSNYKSYNTQQVTFLTGDIGTVQDIKVFVDDQQVSAVSGALSTDGLYINNNLEYNTYHMSFRADDLSGDILIDNRSIMAKIKD